MNSFVQYHNVESEGLPLSLPPFAETGLSIRTSVPIVQAAEGRVFLIAGIGRPRRYFLWETFEIQSVKKNSKGEFVASGTGWQLAPPAELTGQAFEAFQSACANFVGFRDVSKLPYAKTLLKLAEKFRPPGSPAKIVPALKELDAIDGEHHELIREALGHYVPVRALSIRQPHAEAIMRGIKKIEYRSGPTKIRGRVLIYASTGRMPSDVEMEYLAEYRIRDVKPDDLPRGVLIGTVELFDCDDGDWHLRKPVRLKKHVAPVNKGQPIWFYPFNDLAPYPL